MVLDVNEMNLSFGGCGYLGIYHLGAASCFQQHARHVFRNKISGASVGALVASAFLCNVPLETCARAVMDVTMKTRSGLLGALKPENGIMEMLYRNMWAMLPDDAHLYCNGKLHVSVTRKTDQKNVLLNQFDSKKDVVEALMCSCYIPFYCGSVFPKFHGVEYMDGGCSNNMPKLDGNSVRILALYGECDIHPPKNGYVLKTIQFSNTVIYFTLENLIRSIRILCPGSPNMLHDLCQQGYDDALMYLRNHGVIRCPNCKNFTGEINKDGFLEHSMCDLMHESLSPKVTAEFAACLKQLQGSYLDWLYEYQLFRIIYFLNTPNIAIGQWSYFFIKVIYRKLKRKTSTAGNLLNDILTVLKRLMHSAGYTTQHSYQVAAVESGLSMENQTRFNGTPCFSELNDSRETNCLIDVTVVEPSVVKNEKHSTPVTHCNGTAADYKRALESVSEASVPSEHVTEFHVNVVNNKPVREETTPFTSLENNKILQISSMLDVSGKCASLSSLNINLPALDSEAVLS